MFLLPPFLRQFLAKQRQPNKLRIFLTDELFAARIKKLAFGQHRAEQEVYEDLLAAGIKAIEGQTAFAAIWDALSPREKQITALTCLGYRSYEMADMLSISYETVRSHSKHIYAKFGLNKKELRLALKDWDFRTWLESGGNTTDTTFSR